MVKNFSGLLMLRAAGIVSMRFLSTIFEDCSDTCRTRHDLAWLGDGV